MAIPVDFPHDRLGYALVGTKRDMMQNYDTRQNFDGQMLTRGVRDDSTVYFDVSIKVMQPLALLFQIWLKQVINGEEFKITLKTEGGLVEHTCRWAEVPLTPQQGDNFYVYQGVLYSDQLKTGLEDATDEQIDLVYNLGTDFDPLDRLVNEEWPQQ